MPPHSLKSTKTTKRALANAEPAHSTRVRLSRRAITGVQTSTATAPGAVNSLKQSSISKTNGRSPSGKINTNLRAYDRRDPFGAIETLIKLLTSLPSQVVTSGGRQYKLLSNEEHNLSIHLCNIIEPFILSYLSRDDDQHAPLNNSINANSTPLIPRPKFLLMRQPTEILDRIVSFIDAREDLMAFGLSCSRLSEIVFPRHWEYRIIRAKISMIGVWKHLFERTDLAANVRIIEVMDERSDRRVLVPRVCRKSVVVGSSSGAGQGLKVKSGRVKQFESVVSATSTEDDARSSSANEGGNNDHNIENGNGGGGGGGVTLRRVLHKRQEKYFVAALAKLTRLVKVKWESNHSPLSIVDDGIIWRTLVERCGGSLESLAVLDNLAFSPIDDEEDAGEGENKVVLSKSALVNLRSITIQAPQMGYGTPRTPSLTRIASVLHQCPNIQNLEIRFKNSHTLMPVANEFLACGRWTHLTSLTLTNLSCFTTTTVTTIASTSQLLDTLDEPSALGASTVVVQQNPLQTFLAAHSNLESLKILDVGPSPQLRRLRTTPYNMLPKLCELHANRDVVNMILRASCDEARPLKTIKGFRLTGAGCNLGPLSQTGECLTSEGLPHTSDMNLEFYKNLKKAGENVKRIEAEGWGDLDDIRMLATCVPGLTWLDVGRRLRPTSTRNNSSSTSSAAVGKGQNQAHIPVTNMVEWAEALSRFEELATFHGVKFFYEISSNALPNNNILSTNDTSASGSNSASYIPPIINTNTTIFMTDRSRIRKNDEIASVLAWKCAKLRRVDHWEGTPGANGGRIIALFRDSDRPGLEGNTKVRWDVRRVRA